MARQVVERQIKNDEHELLSVVIVYEQEINRKQVRKWHKYAKSYGKLVYNKRISAYEFKETYNRTEEK